MAKRLTNKEFIKNVYNLVGDEYTFLEEYINSRTSILVRHNKCGNIYKVRPSNFIQGHRCPKCSLERANKLKRKNPNDFKKEVYDLVSNEYTFLEEYIDCKTKIKVRHNKCGNEYLVSPNDFKCGSRCPNCSSSRRKTLDEFKNDIYSLVRDEYSVISKEYINNHTEIKIRHNKCGHVYMVKPNNFLNGNRCPKCSSLHCKSIIEFKNDVYNLVGNEYKVLGDYKNNKEKLLMKHNRCGHKYMVTPNNFLRGYRCPKCSVCFSKGEKLIEEILDNLDIYYEKQYKFKNCKYKKSLPFDFALFDDELNEILLLEYDGRQHFKPINNCKDNSVNLEKYKLTKIRDKIKDNYCKSNENIHLLRLNYKMNKYEIYENLINYLSGRFTKKQLKLIDKFNIAEINDYRKLLK